MTITQQMISTLIRGLQSRINIDYTLEGHTSHFRINDFFDYCFLSPACQKYLRTESRVPNLSSFSFCDALPVM